MLAFNQSQHTLSFSAGGQKYGCEPWSSVEIPDELWAACVRMGLPLDIAAVPPEKRAKVQIEEERKTSEEAALFALKERAEAGEARAASLHDDLQKKIVELSDARAEIKRLTTECDGLRAQLERTASDKKTAEELLDAEAKRATAAEAKAIKAEALATERAKQKADKRAAV